MAEQDDLKIDPFRDRRDSRALYVWKCKSWSEAKLPPQYLLPLEGFSHVKFIAG